jgi:hypothetical protein
MSVAGIDIGSFRTPSYVAWLEAEHFVLDAYIASIKDPLPIPPPQVSPATHYAIDAPQGLPRPNADPPIRVSDREAKTPTKRLPMNRKELSRSKIYRALIEAGIEIFWRCHKLESVAVLGLIGRRKTLPVVCETYPRYVLQRLHERVKIPSKRNDPINYANLVMDLLQSHGYHLECVLRPTPDQCDSMLCALAAEAVLESSGDLPSGTVGIRPTVDEEEQVLREGYIVSP